MPAIRMTLARPSGEPRGARIRRINVCRGGASAGPGSLAAGLGGVLLGWPNVKDMVLIRDAEHVIVNNRAVNWSVGWLWVAANHSRRQG
jgi:hypothetical protein